MKYLACILIASSFVVACNNKADQPAEEKEPVVVENTSSWHSTLNDSTGRLEMKQVSTAGPDSLEAAAVIRFLNKENDKLVLELRKVSGDTVYVAIPDATYLTQQMGSTGPTLYFADVVYNLTEIPNIKYVRFDFEEGDHASPGTYSRASFKDE